MKEALSLTIPNKLYFRIGEVADLLDVKPYVLRYWETEFPDIKPSKSKSGQRLYKRRDVELLVHIKDLLYRERFTINGARKKLREIMREQRGYDASQEPLLDGEKTDEIISGNGHPQTPAIEVQPKPQPKPQAAQVKSVLDNRKILSKIKKDLESLLDVLKA